MHPILFKIGLVNVYAYGLMVAVGFCIASSFIYRRVNEFGLDRENILDLFLLVLIGGILGARLVYILSNLPYYLSRPLEIFNLSKGGLVWYGGFAGGLLAALFYTRKQKIDFWNAADLAAPYIALAQSLGRVGCFLNGCCFGMQTKAPFAVIFPGDPSPRHPTQLYSSFALILIFIILRLWQDRRHFKGEIFIGYCLFYSSKRFLMEFLRGDSRRVLFGMTFFQYASIAIFSLSCAALLYMASKWKKGLSNLR